MKKILFFVLAALTFAACEPKEEPKPPVSGDKSIAVRDSEISMNQAEEARIAYETTPAGLAVVFSSSDENIVTVNDMGIVTAGLNEGSATVTVALKDDANVKAEVKVNVLSKWDMFAQKKFVAGITWNKFIAEEQVWNTYVLNDKGEQPTLKLSDGSECILDSLLLMEQFIWTDDQSFNGETLIGNGLMLCIPTAHWYAKDLKTGKRYYFPFGMYTIAGPDEALVDTNGISVPHLPKVHYGCSTAGDDEMFNIDTYRRFITEALTKGGNPKPYQNYEDPVGATMNYWTKTDDGLLLLPHGLIKGEGEFYFDSDDENEKRKDYLLPYLNITVEMFEGDPEYGGINGVWGYDDKGVLGFYPERDEEEGIYVVTTKEVKYFQGERPAEKEVAQSQNSAIRIEAFRKMQQVDNLSNVAMSNLMKDFSALRMNR